MLDKEPQITFVRFLATAVESGTGYRDHLIYVMAGVAQDLLSGGFPSTASDIGEMRNAVKVRIDGRNALRGERIAELADRRMNNRAIVKAEVRAKDAATQYQLAKAERIRSEVAREDAIERARELLSLMRQYGGNAVVDNEDLQRLLDAEWNAGEAELARIEREREGLPFTSSDQPVTDNPSASG